MELDLASPDHSALGKAMLALARRGAVTVRMTAVEFAWLSC